MKKKRIAAWVLAAAVLAGSVGIAAVSGRKRTEEKAEVRSKQRQSQEYTYEYGVVQSLYFKINELWRLSINSELEIETVNAIAALNNGFDSELLVKALQNEGDGVIDEYIYSVLAGLDFELYLSDKEAYGQAKADTVYSGEVLTSEKIDEYLNRLNAEKANEQVSEALNTAPTVNVPNPNTEFEREPVPEVPNAQNLLPENPAEAVKRETEAITNRALGIEVE